LKSAALAPLKVRAARDFIDIHSRPGGHKSINLLQITRSSLGKLHSTGQNRRGQFMKKRIIRRQETTWYLQSLLRYVPIWMALTRFRLHSNTGKWAGIDFYYL
jgi:hypothetical protein